MTVGELKKQLETADDNQRVIFEYQEVPGEYAKESFSVDRTETRFEDFFMLISVEGA